MSSQRLLSLDAFRGMTICLMIVVNTPGTWSHVYPPLLHADWNGITPTDFVFPFFLFIVGVSIVLAFTKRLAQRVSRKELVIKTLKRAVIIFLLGLFLHFFHRLAWTSPDGFGGMDFIMLVVGFVIVLGLNLPATGLQGAAWSTILTRTGAVTAGLAVLFFFLPNGAWEVVRIPGVLQRIAVVYLLAALVFLYTTWRQQMWLTVLVLVGYWAMMTLIPVPIDAAIQRALQDGVVLTASGDQAVQGLQALSEGWLAPNLEMGTNLEAWLDRQLLVGSLYQRTWDPEGVLSTLPALGTALTGMLVGVLILSKMARDTKLIWLLVLGFVWMTAGNVWDWFFPFNKNLWTSSYVLYTSGLATLTLGTMYWLIDVQGQRNWTEPFIAFGSNAITAYVLSGIVVGLLVVPGVGPLRSAIVEMGANWGFDPRFFSLIWALLYTTLIFVPTWVLYKRRIFIKV